MKIITDILQLAITTRRYRIPDVRGEQSGGQLGRAHGRQRVRRQQLVPATKRGMRRGTVATITLPVSDEGSPLRGGTITSRYLIYINYGISITTWRCYRILLMFFRLGLGFTDTSSRTQTSINNCLIKSTIKKYLPFPIYSYS